MKTLDTLKILKITDGRAGHITVTEGTLKAIEKTYNVEVFELFIKIRAKFLLRVLKFVLMHNLLSNRFVLNDFFINLFYKNYQKPMHKIDIIISTGGDTLFINAWMSNMLDAKNIFCSSLRGIDSKYFSIIIGTLEQKLKNYIKLDMAPTKIIQDDFYNKIQYFCNEKDIDINGKYFVLLIGGNGSGYKYNKDDYQKLVYNFISLVKKHKAKALITTSRRTGIKSEKLLKELFLKYNEDIAYSVYFGENPEKVVAVYLELASMVFVTEESGSMITESLYYRKPVFTIRPKIVMEQKRYNLFLNELYNKQRISRVYMENLYTIEFDKFVFKYIKKQPIEELSEKLQPFLKEII